MSLPVLTWQCHVCGDLREDSKISVFTRDVSQDAEPKLPPGTMKINVRYCNDRPKCIDGAPHEARRRGRGRP
jgi:hypothetical protein